MEQKAVFKNTNNVTKISCYITTQNFCPLGDAWYTNNFTVNVDVKDTLVDYLYIEKQINNRIDNKSLIIEDAVAEMYSIFKELGFENIAVESSVTNASHFPVKVVKSNE